MAIGRPGIEPDQTGGKQHLDGQHHHLLNRLPGKMAKLRLGHFRKTATKIGHGPLAVLAIDKIHPVADELRGLQVRVDGKAVHRRRHQANADVDQSVQKFISRFGHGGI